VVVVIVVVVTVVIVATVAIMFHDADALEWTSMGLLPNSLDVYESASNMR